MKIFKEIFGRLWAIWALLFFIITLIVFFIPFLLFCYFLADPKKTHRFILFSRVWMNIYLLFIGCPLKVRGLQHFKKGETYIVVCNHNSLLDVPVSTPSTPGGNKTIAKIEMARIPIFGMIYRTGSVLVDRKRESSRKESYMQMKRVLEMGLHMCIYPEGTRNKSGKLLAPFHGGAFRLAADTGKAVLPGVIFHTRKVLPADKKLYCFPHPLEIHFLSPIPVIGGDNADTMKEKVFKVMWEYLETHPE